jgi:peptide/nickel transport system permease protein
MGLVGLFMLVVVVAMAVLAPWVAPYDPYKPVRARIDSIYAPPSFAHPLGTDDGGKDVLSAFIYGSRVSLIVGFVASAITVLIGGTVGLAAGYYGGRVGGALMGVTNIFLVIPDLPLYVVLVSLLGPSLWNIILPAPRAEGRPRGGMHPGLTRIRCDQVWRGFATHISVARPVLQ